MATTGESPAKKQRKVCSGQKHILFYAIIEGFVLIGFIAAVLWVSGKSLGDINLKSCWELYITINEQQFMLNLAQ